MEEGRGFFGGTADDSITCLDLGVMIIVRLAAVLLSFPFPLPLSGCASASNMGEVAWYRRRDGSVVRSLDGCVGWAGCGLIRRVSCCVGVCVWVHVYCMCGVWYLQYGVCTYGGWLYRLSYFVSWGCLSVSLRDIDRHGW